MPTAVRATLVSGTGALVASQVISATPKNLQEIMCVNTSGSALYVQVFDSATVPADSTTPAIVFTVPANSTAGYDNTQGLPFASGIAVCVSTTAHTKTVAGAVAVFTALVEN